MRTLFNPFYKVADNLASCWMARGELRGNCLLINGDTLFEPAIARRLIEAPAAPITLTIDRKPRYDDDDMKVITEGERLRAVGKKLAEGVNGESIGFSRFQGDGAALFVAELERTMRTKEGTSLWYLSAMNRLAGSGADVRVVSIEGLDWGELDFAADLGAGAGDGRGLAGERGRGEGRLGSSRPGGARGAAATRRRTRSRSSGLSTSIAARPSRRATIAKRAPPPSSPRRAAAAAIDRRPRA